MKNISFLQQLANDLNKKLAPEFLFSPGKGEITIVETGKNGSYQEFYLTSKDDKTVKLTDSYQAKHDDNYQKLEDALKDYR